MSVHPGGSAQWRKKENHLCPACGTVLYGRSCKLRCKKCGFFEDCSDGVGANMNYETEKQK